MTVMLKFTVVFISLMAISRAINVEEAFINSEIVPNYIEKAPTSEADVCYSESPEANLGNYLKVKSLVFQPDITWAAEPNLLYTLLMFDPDPPMLTEPQVFIHWLITNIEGGDLTTGNIIFEYLSPNPAPPGSHRYITLLYQQNDRIADDGLKIKNRFWKVADFEEKYGLKGPVAGNFYRAVVTKLF